MDKPTTPKTEYKDGKRVAQVREEPVRKPAHHSRQARPAPKRRVPLAVLLRRCLAELKREARDLRDIIVDFFTDWSERFQSGRASYREVMQSRRDRGFPESTHLLLQLLLFLWGILPFAAFKFTELLHIRRIRNIRRGGRRQQLQEAFRVHPGAFLAGTGAVLAVAMFFTFYTTGIEVSYRGTVLGSVHEEEEVQIAQRSIETAARENFNSNYTLDESAISCTSKLTLRSDLLTADDIENLLSEQIGFVTKGYALYIDDELICATEYEHVLEDLLQQLKYAYTTENTVSCDFEEKVEVRSGYVPTSYLMSVSKIAETLNSTHEEEVIYSVKAGDVWSRIAKAHDMSSKELEKLNPGYNTNRLHVGDQLVLSAAVPYLTITFTEQQHYLSDVPYEVEYREDSSMYKGDYKVLSPGVYGKADVLADVTYKNGEEVDRVVRAFTNLTEPVTEIQAVGTKARPTWHPTGDFRWPCNGTITSRFGGRNLWGRYNYHGGIDIANRAGTPIYAADGGTVTHAGWMGTYGYLVIIDHGNGFETYYGHNSKLLVSKGDKVHKGEQIAKMGRTGNTSGNHCHFEVRYHGARKNPLNYI